MLAADMQFILTFKWPALAYVNTCKKNAHRNSSLNSGNKNTYCIFNTSLFYLPLNIELIIIVSFLVK